MTAFVKCKHCSGSGSVRLSDRLQVVVNAVSLCPSTISEIQSYVCGGKGVSITAMHRRVERLVQMGLLRKVAKSKPARYELA